MLRALFLGSLVLVLAACPEKAAPPSEPAFVNTIPPIPEGARKVAVKVVDTGYEPHTIDAQANESLVLSFTRVSESECGRYVQVNGTDIKAELPLNTPVDIPITAPESGKIVFACGMDMMHGVVQVVPVAGAAEPPPDDGEAG